MARRVVSLCERLCTEHDAQECYFRVRYQRIVRHGVFHMSTHVNLRQELA